jgi:hypothetical protein
MHPVCFIKLNDESGKVCVTYLPHLVAFALGLIQSADFIQLTAYLVRAHADSDPQNIALRLLLG